VAVTTPWSGIPTLAITDFNEDGKPDIAYIATDSATMQSQLRLLINQGGGSFLDEAAPGVTSQVSSFVVGDFNLDGHIDLAMEPGPPAVSQPVVSVQVYFGQGNGSFVAGPVTNLANNMLPSFQFVAGDFDHDGIPDLAAVDGGTGHILLLWGDGTGSFSLQQVNGPQGFSLTTGDVNGDGIPDIIIPGELISVVLGQDIRNFPSPSSYLGAASSLGDVTGNHELDILSPGGGTPPDQIIPGKVYLNNGSGQYTLGGSPPNQGFVLADLNGDGLADLIGSDGTNILIWPGTGDPSFSGSSEIVIAPSAGMAFYAPALQVADMDGDGRPDLVMPFLILYNNGNVNFTPVQVMSGYTSTPFVIGNFNRDGLLDIAAGGFTLLGQRNRTLRQVTANGLNMTAGVAAVGDFNGDGYPDIVYGGNTYGLVVEYGRGDGTFYQQSQLNIGGDAGSPISIAVVDVNGDGQPDIVACSGQCAIFTNDGQGGFERSYFACGSSIMPIMTGDLKGNGKPGLVITTNGGNFLVVLEK
jgi:hypothetical protein